MSNSKALSDSGWKDVSSKNKIKDNGLLKALADYKRIDEERHDDALKALELVLKLAGQMKKDKTAGGVAAVGKHLGEVIDAAESDQRTLVKAKAEHEKAQKSKAEAEKKAAAKKDEDGEGDEEEEESPELLTVKLKPLLRRVAKGERMHALLAKSGKQVVVMLSPKPIPPSRRKMLAEQLGGGSTKYFPGHCHLEAGAMTFTLKAEVAGMSKLVKAALLEQTGLRLNKLKCRGEDGDDDDGDEDGPAGGAKAGSDGEEDEAGDGGDKSAQSSKADKGENGAKGEKAETADAGGQGGADAPAQSPTGMARPFEVSDSVGRGGKNLEEDVRAVQAALNRRTGGNLPVDGRCGPETLKAIVEFQQALGQSRPDGRVDPGRGTARALAASGKIGKPPSPPSPKAPPEDLGDATLSRAPQVWHGMRGLLDHNIGELKRAIKQEYSSEHPSILAEIDQSVQRVDVLLEKLDTRLAQTLERAGAAKDSAQRKAEIASAKTILADYVAFVKSEPLIDHIDKNPFGVDAQVRKTITDSLKHMIKSMA